MYIFLHLIKLRGKLPAINQPFQTASPAGISSAQMAASGKPKRFENDRWNRRICRASVAEIWQVVLWALTTKSCESTTMRRLLTGESFSNANTTNWLAEERSSGSSVTTNACSLKSTFSWYSPSATAAEFSSKFQR